MQFSQQKTNLQQGAAIAIIDFKENLHLNLAVEETGHNFYNRPQRAYFSLAVYYKNENNELVYKFFDCISKNLTKTSWWTIKALDFIFQTKEWQELNISKISLWMDNGPGHFCTKEFLYY